MTVWSIIIRCRSWQMSTRYSCGQLHEASYWCHAAHPDPTPHAAAATETIATVGTIGGGGPAAGVCTEAASSGATFSTTCAFHALPTSPQRIGAFPFAA